MNRTLKTLISGHTRAVAFGPAVAVALFLTACGGSSAGNGSPDTSASTPMSTATAIPQARHSPPCPPDAPNSLSVASEHRRTWSACANFAGTTMYVYNISEAALLASSVPGATLHRELPLIVSSGHEAALDALSALTDRRPDPQANGQLAWAGSGWVYVAPQSYVKVTSPSGIRAGAYLRIDYYATVQYTIARVVGDYLLGKVTPRPSSLLNALTGCGQQLNVTAEMVNDPPPPINVVQNLVRTGSGCYAAVKTLDPGVPTAPVLADDLAGEARGFTKGLLLKLPAEVWEKGFQLLAQLAHFSH